ncbi:MAG: hypothetical protein H6710_19830 [Myxococcales bacterium]|nr:hypothetical protein [Myxococcales bacterium]MCB9706235.1 hypothetical protein [Myxococcales bacterium]
MPDRRPDQALAERVAACRELLEGEPDLLADFDAALGGPLLRWELLAEDLRRDFAEIAWDHLIRGGLAPADDARAFIERIERRCPACDGAYHYDRCPRCDGTGRELEDRRCDHPPTLRAALTLASFDLAAAEALAREAAARLWPWRGRRGAIPRPSEPPRTIAWRVDEGDGPLELVRRSASVCPLLYEALLRSGRRVDASIDLCQYLYWMTETRHRDGALARYGVAPDIERRADEFFDALAASSERVSTHLPRSRRHPSPPAGQPYAALPNPLTPTRELWGLGAAIERLEGDAVIVALKAEPHQRGRE